MDEKLYADILGAVCPVPFFDHKQIVMGHGGGGKLTADLIQNLFLPAFKNEYLARLDDQAVLNINSTRLLMSIIQL